MKVKATTLTSEIAKLNKGDVFYVNAINLSTGAIDKLRGMIQNKEIIADTEYIGYSDTEGVKTGKVILPQNQYWKN